MITQTRLKPRLAVALLSAAFAAGTIAPAYAAIDNSATASGTYNSGTVTSSPSTASVPVVPAGASMTVSKTAGTITTALGSDSSIVDAGDTITYTYTIQNTGNVTLSSVTPVDTGPTFDGNAGTGTMGSFSLTSGSVPLTPGATAVFSASYTLSALDVYRSAGATDAVSNTASASAQDPASNAVTAPDSTATTTIPAGPLLSVSKSASLDDTAGTNAGVAEVGETITYTYTITNTGNVAITDVGIADTHEGSALSSTVFTAEALSSEGPLGTPASTDATANNGVWDLLQPGAVITITYTHTVTQTEVDNQ